MLKKVSKILFGLLFIFLMCACTNNLNFSSNDKNNLNKEEEKQPIDKPSNNEIPTGYKLYTHSVSMSDTFGNSILPNSYVGIYTKTDSKEGYIIANVKVLAVLDENNENAFSENEAKTPSKILFYLSNSDYSLLEKAKVLGEISLIPGSTSNLNQEVIDYILNS